MTYLLFIDTSTDTGMVAISGNTDLLGMRVNDETRNHASSINNMISSLLDDINISFAQLSAVVVCAGPGSYTGLRIGLATAKGLCYALDKPLILDNKLTLLAHNARIEHPGYEQYVSLITARANEYFICIYDHDFTCLHQPAHIMQEQLNIIDTNKKTYVISDTEQQIFDNLKIIDLQIDPHVHVPLKTWVPYAFEKYICNRFVNLMEAEPFYLKQVYTHK